MRKKVALLLSAIMALSPVSVFAASSNTISKQPSAVIGKTLFMEENWSYNNLINLKIGDDKTKEIEYVVDGSTLFIKPTNGNIKAGDTIKIALDNATWFFRHNTSDGANAKLGFDEGDLQGVALLAFIEKYGVIRSLDTTELAAPYTNKITVSALGNNYGINTSWFEQLARNYAVPATVEAVDATAGDVAVVPANIAAAYTAPIPFATTDFTNKRMIQRIATETSGGDTAFANDFVAGTNEVSTYNTAKGVYYPNSTTYVKTNDFEQVPVAPAVAIEPGIAYTLTISNSDDNIATLRFYEDYKVENFTTTQPGIPIPLVSLSKGEGDVRVRIGEGSNLTTITSQNIQYGLASSSNTITSVNKKVNAKYNFPLERIEIRERVPYSIEQGKITMTAPYGFYWADPTIKLTADKAEDEVLPVLRAAEDLFFKGNETRLENESVTINGNKVGRYLSYAYQTDTLGVPDFSKPIKDKLIINTDVTPFAGLPSTETGLGLQHSTKTNGVLIVEGMVLIAQDYAPIDQDIKVHIKGDGVTEQDFVIGTRKEWGVDLKRLTAVTKLVSGRFTDEKNSGEFDKDHKTARVKFSENVIASWWALRESEFVLSEGSKFRKVVIEDEDNFNHVNTSYALEGTYRPQAERTSYITLDASKLRITDLAIKRNSTAEFEMDIWVSVQPGWEGDVMLYASGSEILEETTPLKIAYAVSPITVTSEVKDVKIGYQWQKVADIIISETEPSMLKRGTEVEIFIDDAITGSDNIAIAPDFITEVNTDSKILFTKPAVYDGSIMFTIDRNSYGKAATIKFSNVYVKIDRTVPESNRRPYQIVIGGDAVAANYSNKPGIYEAKFNIKGIGVDYLNVVTSANDRDSILSNIVRVTIGSNEVLIGREGTSNTVHMDTAAYISSESNSTMVPVRFVSQALGIPDNQILWDNEARTVTIYNGSRIIQFTIDSSEMNINGVTTTMYSADNVPLKVKAEVKDDRSFLPFRALGNALGVSVDWKVDTQTATYNNEILEGYTDKLEITTETQE